MTCTPNIAGISLCTHGNQDTVHLTLAQDDHKNRTLTSQPYSAATAWNDSNTSSEVVSRMIMPLLDELELS